VICRKLRVNTNPFVIGGRRTCSAERPLPCSHCVADLSIFAPQPVEAMRANMLPHWVGWGARPIGSAGAVMGDPASTFGFGTVDLTVFPAPITPGFDGPAGGVL
jgi:hypothetical protein